ncbi:MAG: tetratricopeptide repeat protein [Melioribacteraceae bacterium]|nr:tetratricopeptide repeat protein [Melioribacteraceae bacterium]
MIKKILLLLLFVSAIKAQPNLDSLLISINHFDDTLKVKYLTDLSFEYRSKNPQMALKYGKKALEIIDRLATDKYRSEAYNFIGVVYGNIGELDSAVHYYRKALQVAETIKDSLQIAYTLNNIGDYYHKTSLYSFALEKILQAYDIFEKFNDREGMAYTLNDIGEVYFKQNHFDRAMGYFQEAELLRRELNDKRGIAKTLINQANVLINRNQFDEALNLYEYVLELADEIGYTKGKSWVYSGMSLIYKILKRYNLAIEFSKKALEIDLEIDNKYGEIVDYNELGRIYFELGDFNNSEIYLDLARREAARTGHLDQLMVANKAFTQLFTAQNNYRKAYESMVEYEELKDSIFSTETSNHIADLQTAFVEERKNRENQILLRLVDYEKSTRIYLILASILTLIAVIFMISKYKTQKKANELLNDLNDSKDKFFSVIAHDLKNPFGALMNISELLKSDYNSLTENERIELVKSIFESSKDINRMLNDLLTWSRSQKGEVKITKEQLNLNEIIKRAKAPYDLVAKNKNITVKIDIDPNLEVFADKYILEIVVANLLHNAIKFSHSNGLIIINAKEKDGRTNLIVRDFGKGIDKDTIKQILLSTKSVTTEGTQQEKGTGLGLKISKEFLQLHGSILSVESEVGKGTAFTVTI